jgi:hypothetical protein
VKVAKVTPSSELVGAVTRAKDSKYFFKIFYEFKIKFNINFFSLNLEENFFTILIN